MSEAHTIILQALATIVGGVMAYLGAQSAMRERLARVEELAKHAKESASDAHDRIDRILSK